MLLFLWFLCCSHCCQSFDNCFSLFFYSVLYFAKGHLFCRETFKIAIIEFWPKTELGNNWNHVCHPIYPTSNILRWEKKRNFFFSVKSSRIHYTVQEDAYPTEKSLNLPLVSFDQEGIEEQLKPCWPWYLSNSRVWNLFEKALFS